MKRSAFYKIIFAIMAATLAAILATTLFACVKDPRPNDDLRRSESAVGIRSAFISGIDRHWKGEMSDEEVAALDNGGDYVVAIEWTELMCDVLKKSSLQTSKLELISSTLSGDEGKKLFEDFSANATLLMPLLRTVGLTQADAGNMIYDLIYAVVDRSAEVFDAMAQRLRTVRVYAVSDVALENITTNMSRVSSAKAALVASGEEKERILSAFVSAKQPLSALVAFAYNMSVGTLTDELLGKLTDGGGALANITDSEIAVVMGQLVNNVSSLKASLGDEGTDKLDAALKIVIDKFDVDLITSSVYGELVRYAKYGYMAIDALPAFCDVVTEVGNLLRDGDFINVLRRGILANSTGEENVGRFSVNSAIAAAKLSKQVMDAFDETSLKALIQSICARGNDDFQKAVPIMLVDVVYNLSSLFGSVEEAEKSIVVHPDIISSDDLAVMLNSLLYFVRYFDKFKMAYADFEAGRIDISALATAAADCKFSVFGIENAPVLQANSSREVVRLWYDFYVKGDGYKQIVKRLNECRVNATKDLIAFVDDYFGDGSQCREAVEKLAAMSVKDGDISAEEADQLNKLISDGNLFGMVTALYLVFFNS